MYLRNTVVAGNTATTAGPNIFATTGAISAGHNLIGDGTGSNFTPVIGDLVGTTSAPIDPLLAPLAQNGGPTPTMLPLLNSPVVDRGTNVAAPAVDQRGLQRSVGCATDIGAVEVQTDSNCTDCCDPANDNCGDAVTLLPAGTGVLGVPGDLTLATLDGPSTVCGVGVGRDVWYRFQPNASADWDIRTCSDGGVDTVIELFDGCSGTSVACNDDADGCGDGTQSRLVVPLDGSVSYLLRICSKLAAPAGPFNLEVTRAVPSNDDCTGATFLSSFPFTDSPYHLLATHDPIIMGCNPGPGLTRHGVWYAYTPSTDCTLIVSETSANDVAMALFTGADCGSLVEVACTLAETDAFALTANTSYWQLIGMHSATAVPTTPLVIEFECVPPFPNDDCATATVIAETPFSHTVDFRLAAPDPDVTCNQSSNVHTRHGVWWTYTPSIDCIAVLSETSTNDTITAVFTGGCDNLFEVHCSDAEGSIFTMQAGVQYHVLVGAWSATTILTTPITFNLDCVLPPENDACINAIPLVCDTSVAGSTTLATAEGVPVPATCPDTFEGGSNLVQNHRKGVWYRVIGDGNAWTLSTCNAGTNFDTQIAVFTGGCDNPICFVANDDMNQTGWSCPISSRRAAVRFGTVPGEEYLVLVMPSSSGPAVPSNFQLDVICTGCCQDGDCIFVSADACAAGGGAPPVDATSCGPPEGHALDFAGNNGYVNVGTLGTFGSTLNTFTAELWVRTTDTSQIHVPLKLIDTPGTPTDPVFAIEMNRTNLGGGAPVYAAGQTLFYLRDGNNMVFSRSISANIYDGQWHHIAWRVLDAVNNNMEVYVDGGLHPQIEGLSQSPVNFPDWTRFLTIGAANNRGTIEAWFNGQIDDVRLWAVARTQVQIFANMNLSVAPNTPGLYAAWRLDDGAGTTALDLNGVYHGTLVGGPSWIDSSPCAVPCGPADINCDGVLDMADVDVFVGVLLSTNTDPDHVARSDFNGDGVADGMDIQLFAEHILDG
ncbi:MAG: hypothetical protein HUU22_17690 [Phycisphaerae bacterium]|nr:hypothetical protein [Phycisphaerae bacterium]NUQ47855.1 hypothetical protein [Phycisphaerae bacterium]